MKNVTWTLLGLGALALAGCTTHETEVVHERPTVIHETVVHETTVPSREVVVVDQHRAWWESQHRAEAYDRDRALAAHRMWCNDHPADVSCSGWDYRN